jgi:hypothetical protein
MRGEEYKQSDVSLESVVPEATVTCQRHPPVYKVNRNPKQLQQPSSSNPCSEVSYCVRNGERHFNKVALVFC